MLTSGGCGKDWDQGVDFSRMREQRLARTKASLKQWGIAAALLTRPENIRYATGGKGLDFIDQTRYALVTCDHDPILFEPHGTLAGVHPWIKPENIRQAYQWASQACGPDATRQTAGRFAEQVKQTLGQLGLEGERLGVDSLDDPGRQALNAVGLQTMNVMPAMLDARALKTADEIQCLKLAVAIAETGWAALYDALRPGVRDRDLIAVANEAMYRAGAEDVWAALVSSGGSGQGTDRIVQVGDLVVVDFVRCTYLGYNTCFYRSAVVGRRPSQKVVDKYKRMYDRMSSVLEAIRPGVTTAEVAQLWESAEQKGHSCEDAVWCDDMGHGIGLWLYEYPLVNRLWSIEHPQTFQPGMTLAVEALDPIDPVIGRLKVEEMIVVTESGVELLNRLPGNSIMIANEINYAT